MINRNRNSAVDRARAEMKQAVNSSRRSVRSANRLNSSRYTKDKMIRAMEAAGYWYDDIDSYDDGYVVFRGEYGSLTFDNLNEVADWLDGVVFDDPAVAEEVYAILNSNRRVNSSRHMSYKTRKAVEYSINCARRRAGLNCGVGSKVQIPGILNFIKKADFTECPIAAKEFDRAIKSIFRMPVGSSLSNVTLSDHYANIHESFEEVLYETLKSSESAQELGENDTYYVFLNTYDPAGNKAKFFTGVSCYNGKFTFNPSEMRYFYF